MRYLIISFSHKNTNIDIREKLVFNSDEKSETFLSKLKQNININEAVLLSTCNRVEIILSVKDVLNTSDFIFELLSNYSGISKYELEGRADVYEDNGAIHHLFCVSSSLDSLVVGETQIAGQLKDAFRFSFNKGFCAQKLARAFHFAFKCAANVRNQTDISKNPVSVASAAVVQAKELLGELGGNIAIVVGAGEMAILSMKNLVQLNCNVILVNRDVEKAKELSKDFSEFVTVEPISKLKELINRYRIIFSATGAPHVIITKDMIEERNFKRYWFDLAVPRDIEDIYDENIKLFSVDNLQQIVNTNIALREEHAKKAYEIVGRSTHEFFRWLQTLQIEPIVKEIRLNAINCAKHQIARALKKNIITEDEQDKIFMILNSTLNQFLHNPTVKLKKLTDDPVADTIVEAVKYMFDFEKDMKMLNKYKCEHYDSKEKA
ncbi:MAG: glutamyl-tRNA reductase [Campylobacterales bacterium]|nr:glutamyl-tRNA reductase [Campylobacterales bacterium]